MFAPTAPIPLSGGTISLGIKAVIFDVDGTLFDRDMAQKMAIEGIIGKFPHVFSVFEVESVVAAFLESDRLSVVDFEAGLPSDSMRAKRTKTFLRLLGAKEDYANAITETYVRDYPMINSPIAGSVPLVKELSTRFRLGVISNGLPDVQYRKIETIGLKGVFSSIVLSEEIGIRKPDPRIFQRAADSLRIRLPECLYVGDSYHDDVIGAKTAGMQVCWYNCRSAPPGKTGIQADFVIADIKELSGILEE